MMQRWARFVTGTSWVWILVWPVAGACVYSLAPRIPTLLVDSSQGFLPDNLPSRTAHRVLSTEFPDHAPASRAVVVFSRETTLGDDDFQFVDAIARELISQSDRWQWQVHAVAGAPYLAPILHSPDGRATMIAVDLPAEFLTQNTVNRVRELQRVVSAHESPVGLETNITGAAALAELLDSNARSDVDTTTLWAVGAVALILLIIYRSPVAMLLPLTTIAAALMLSLGLIGWAASSWLPINGLVEMFAVVMVVGSGVDYCLFLFSRFKEEFDQCGEVRESVERAVARSGTAILAGAGTNIIGLGMMILGKNRDLYTSGPTIGFAIAIATLSVLTLAPALMCVAGRRMFWPFTVGSQRERDSTLWRRVARITTNHPGAAVTISLLFLAPAALYAVGAVPTYDELNEFPKDSSFVQGATVIRERYFDGHEVSNLSILIETDAPIGATGENSPTDQILSDVYTKISKKFPIAYYRDLSHPLGRSVAEVSPSPETTMEKIARAMLPNLARSNYIGRSGKTTRIDMGLQIAPRTPKSFTALEELRGYIADAFSHANGEKFHTPLVHIVGDTAVYADMATLRQRDFRVVATGAIVAIFGILVWLVKSPLQAAILVLGTVVTYLCAYGGARAIFQYGWGVSGLNYQLDFLLFIVILSLGQDYNIYVITRIREGLAQGKPPRDAVEDAVHRTGKVVSSCGVIMAATFASMFSGSLLLMKEFAVALALGILIDTFIIRPLTVPAAVLLVLESNRHDRK